MSKVFWTILSGTLLFIKSVSATTAQSENIAYKSDINSIKQKFVLDTGFKHLNFFHKSAFTSSYLILTPKLELKNFKFDASAWFSESRGGLETFSVREIYYTRYFKGLKLSFGRKIQEWTKEELLKPTGFWSNNWDFNKSDPRLEGNLGIFVEKTFDKKNKLSAFISPLSIPKVVTHNEVSDEGSVVERTPWSTSPPRQIEYAGSSLPINYALEDINYLELVQSFQVGGTYDFEGEGVFTKVSYLFAPSKDLDLGLDFVLDSSSQNTPVEISISPESYNVHMFALDFGFKWSNKGITGFSFNHRERARGITSDARQSFTGVGSGSLFQIYHKQSFLKERLSVTGFLTENTQIRNLANGELGELLRTYLSVPFRFVRGAGFTAKFHLTESIKALSTFYYDVESDGVLGRFLVQMKLPKSFNAQLGFDTVEALSDKSEGFYRDFRQNDFVYGGLSYAF